MLPIKSTKHNYPLKRDIIAGDLPRKQTRLVQAWVELHRDELVLNYQESQHEGKLKKIKPLD